VAAARRAQLDEVPYHRVDLPFRGYRRIDDLLEQVPPDNLRHKGRPF
jgi:hypothetical protein